MNEYYQNFINKNKLRIFNIDPHKLRGKKFFEEIFNYRKKIYKAQQIRIKKKKQNNFLKKDYKQNFELD